MLGMTCPNRMRDGDVPMACAASTYNSFLVRNTSARTRRQYPGHHTSEIAITTLIRLGPSAADTAIARIRSGTVRNTSVTRWINVSVRPP